MVTTLLLQPTKPVLRSVQRSANNGLYRAKTRHRYIINPLIFNITLYFTVQKHYTVFCIVRQAYLYAGLSVCQ